MLLRTSEIIGCDVLASDGAIGSVVDLLFDDREWVLRWAVVDTGNWLPGRQVLIPPAALRAPEPSSGAIPVDMNREQIRESPGLGTDEPVSRRLESELYDYYGWAPYWTAGPAAYGAALAPPASPVPPTAVPGDEMRQPEPPEGDPNLRSAGEVSGYYIGATDGEIGHVDDLLVERESWAVRYLIADTGNWLPGRKVLIAPPWAREIDWGDREVRVDLSRRQVEESPEYNPAASVEQDYEARLHEHYGETPYWAGGVG